MKSFRSTLSLFIIGFCLFTTSLKAQTENLYTDPVVYNDFIVSEQDKIGAAILDFTDTFGEEPINETRVRTSYQLLLDQIAASVVALENLRDYGGNIELRDASLALFRFYDRIVKNQYGELLEIMIKPEFTSEDEARYYELVDSITGEEGAYDERFAAAQNAFAEKYNIELVDKSGEE